MDDSDDKTFNVAQPSAPLATGAAFEEGQILGGKYKVMTRLGSGGMGTVYRVKQVFLNKEFALKTIDSQQISDVAMMRFQTEARAASLLDHPNLVKVYDFGLLDSSQPFLVMDFVHGVTLADRLESGSLEVENAARLFAQVCLGLAYAHDKGVVHRDIKPSNIMLVNGKAEGTEGSVKVVDFGIAKLTASEDGYVQALTRTGEIFGSPLYMSPEQCSGAIVDYRSDVYSLGCVLFEALTGAPPHLGQNALTTMMLHQSEPASSLSEASMGTTFPVALEQIVAKMLSKVPADRYTNLGLVALDLSAVGGDSPNTQSRFASTPPLKTREPQTLSIAKSYLYSLIGIGALVGAAVTAVGGYFYVEKTVRSIAESSKISTVDTSNPADQQGDYKKFSKGTRTAEDLRPISSTVKFENGVAERIFAFPSYEIGTVRWLSTGNIPNVRPAIDTVRVPVGAMIAFNLDALRYPAILDNLAVFERIRPTEFGGLEVKGAGLMDDATIKSILNTASRWPGLISLSLEALPGDSSVLSKLNAFQSMRELRMSNLTHVDSSWLAHQPFFYRLEKLELRKIDSEPIILRLATQESYNLNMLSLEDANLSTRSLVALQRCPSLNYLLLDGKTFTDEQIKAITGLKALVVMNFGEALLTDKQIKTILGCPSLQNLYLSERVYRSQSKRDQIRKLDTRIVLGNRQ